MGSTLSTSNSWLGFIYRLPLSWLSLPFNFLIGAFKLILGPFFGSKYFLSLILTVVTTWLYIKVDIFHSVMNWLLCMIFFQQKDLSFRENAPRCSIIPVSILRGMLRTPNIDSILVGFLTFITSVLVIGEHYFFILLAGLVYFGLIKSFVDCLPQAYGSQSNSWFWGSPKSSPNPVKKEVDVPKNSTLHFISKPFLDSLTQMWKKMTNADTPATNSNDPLSQKKTSATSNDSLSQNKAPANNNKALSQNGTPANNNKALSQNGTSQTARRGLRK